MAQDRKTYSLTDEGKEAAAEVAGTAPWDDESDADHSSRGVVPKAGFELAQAVAQVARTGTAEQQSQAAELLNETRRKIYSILAQD